MVAVTYSLPINYLHTLRYGITVMQKLMPGDSAAFKCGQYPVLAAIKIDLKTKAGFE
jgi:hypothetical protein